MLKVGILLSIILMSGCSSETFVGDWQPEPLPKNVKNGIFHFSPDGSYAGQVTYANGDIKRSSGQWESNSTGHATATTVEMPDKPATLTLTDKNHMVYTMSGETVELIRQQSAK